MTCGTVVILEGAKRRILIIFHDFRRIHHSMSENMKRRWRFSKVEIQPDIGTCRHPFNRPPIARLCVATNTRSEPSCEHAFITVMATRLRISVSKQGKWINYCFSALFHWLAN
jgi:hypothetical protein